MKLWSNRLNYVKCTSEGLADYFQFGRNEAVMRYVTFGALSNTEAVDRYGAALAINSQNTPLGYWMAYTKDENELIVYLKIIDLGNGQHEVGYLLLPAQWGKGYATEVTAALVDYAKAIDDITELVGIVDNRNGASKKVLTKNGFEYYKTEETEQSVELYFSLGMTSEKLKVEMDKYEITIKTWDSVADLYQEKFMDLDLYNDSYDSFEKQIKIPNAKILEIGCGPGNITKYLLSRRPDFKIDATDVSPNMVQLAKKNNPGVNGIVIDARAVDQLKGRYNGIMCGFCLPYLSKADASKLIKDSARLLEADGVLYLSVIEGDYAQSEYVFGSSAGKVYTYYYDEKDMKEWLQANQFEVVDRMKKTYEKGDGSEQITLIFLAKKIVKE